MFTNDDQQTTRRAQRYMGRWLWSLATCTSGSIHALAIRVNRRVEWFRYFMTLGKLINLASAVTHFALRSERSSRWPVFTIIDISPACNLHCTVCLHAEPHGNPALLKQQLDPSQRMRVDEFRRIIAELEGHALAVLLYYVGDPLAHPDLEELCGVAAAAHLNTHVCTNLSFLLSDVRLHRLVDCGLTHLTVCVDGLSQAKYELTRVGGRIDLVLSNLQRICAYRQARGRRYPQVEVQYLKYQHNLDELDEARRRFRDMGVDQFHETWGWLHNYTDRDPGRYTVRGPQRNRSLPRCHWPYLATLVKYDGDVIPCCSFRLGEQYTATDTPRAVGNALRGGVAAVWNSPAYREIRRFAARPEAYATEPGLAETFCDQCPRLFDTDYRMQTCRFGNEHTFEELYTRDAQGHPVRRRETGMAMVE